MTLFVSLVSSIFARQRISPNESALYQFISLIMIFAAELQMLGYSQVAITLGISIAVLSVIIFSPLLNLCHRLFFKMGPQFKIPLGVQIMDFLLLLVTYCGILFFFVIASWYSLFYIVIGVLGFIAFIMLISRVSEKKAEIRVTEKDEPDLFKLLKELTQEYGIPLPSKVILLPDDTVAVTGVFRKTLMVGLIPLRVLSRTELKAIFAHEFGHFYGKDTLFGGFIYSFVQSLDYAGKIIRAFSRIHAIMFIVGMGLLFIKWILSMITVLYMRQREYFADIYAVHITGPKTFGDALSKIVGYSVLFNKIMVMVNIQLWRTKKSFMKNMYQDISKRVTEKDINTAALQSPKPPLLSSHPSLQKRLNMLSKISATEAAHGKDAASLFKNLKKYEEDFSPFYSVAVLSRMGVMTYSELEELKRKSKLSNDEYDPTD